MGDTESEACPFAFNGFLQVALFYGLVGLALFLALFATGLAKAYLKLREARLAGDRQMVLIGSSLIGCMLATFVFMATAGSSYLQWLWVGLLVSYSGIQVAGTVRAGDPSPGVFANRHRRSLAA